MSPKEQPLAPKNNAVTSNLPKEYDISMDKGSTDVRERTQTTIKRKSEAQHQRRQRVVNTLQPSRANQNKREKLKGYDETNIPSKNAKTNASMPKNEKKPTGVGQIYFNAQQAITRKKVVKSKYIQKHCKKLGLPSFNFFSTFFGNA